MRFFSLGWPSDTLERKLAAIVDLTLNFAAGLLQAVILWHSLKEKSQIFDIYISMRLSPMRLASCFYLNHDMNGLEWRFVFPRYDDLLKNSRPKCFGEYLALNKSVQIVAIDNYDIDIACEFLDKAYDFSQHKNKPTVSRQQGGVSQ